MNRRAFCATVGTVLASSTLAACTPTSFWTPPRADEQGAPVLMLIPGIASPFYHLIQEGAQAEAQKQGATYLSQTPTHWDANEQAQIVHAAMARNVDAIIITPCDADFLITPLQQASDAGIKIVTVDTFLGNGDYTQGAVTFPVAFIGSDNVEGGKLVGEALIKAIGGKGQVYLQNNASQASTAAQRAEGFKAAIAATKGAVTLVGEGFDQGDQSTATTQMAAILTRYPDLAGVFGADSYSTAGAITATQHAQKNGSVKIACFDSSQEAIAALQQGNVDLVIGQLPKQMGTLAVQAALAACHGQSVQKQQTTDFIVIDRHNVDAPAAQAAIYR